MMQELRSLKCSRCVVPEDAVNLEVTTIDTGDATCSLACTAVYARYLRKNGDYSCQLIFGRSKVMPVNITQPRAELLAAKLNAQTGYVVKRSLAKYYSSGVKLSDSQITLHWINSSERPLKQWVRNNVIEICRLTDVSDWYYVHSKQMVADIGTRRNVTVKDVSADSIWANGFEWMKQPKEGFPIKGIKELILNENDLKEYTKETPNRSSAEFKWYGEDGETNVSLVHHAIQSPDLMEQRYIFSNYLVDPNKHRFQTVVRIIAIVKRFIRYVHEKVKDQRSKGQLDITQGDINSATLQVNNGDQMVQSKSVNSRDVNAVVNNQPISTKPMIILSNDEIAAAQNYFFEKASKEIKHFVCHKKLKKISKEVGGILYYTGRILPNQEFAIAANLSKVMLDLTTSTFCVPLVDKNSPLAYSIINDIHWYHEVASHRGVETVLRYTMLFAHIIEGRELAKYIRSHCERCRFLMKKTIDITMAPISKHNLCIAPAFYVTQVDLAGPFKAFTPHNKRSTLKIYFVIFCCATTSTLNIKVMEDYTTSSFVNTFIRFSCEVGYPKIVLPDPGSQLIKGCESMKLNYSDLKYHLHLQMGVDFEPCPVGGHHVHGKVERKIQHVKNSIEKKIIHERLSILEWETLGAEISNSINDMPIGLGSKVADLENLDLLTPNRLKLGRNNNRSPIGPVDLTCDLSKFLSQNKEIFDGWFECWLLSYVPTLIEQPKWFKKDCDVTVGDVVLFLKEDKAISGRYQYGMIDQVERGKDNLIRTVMVKYRNSHENFDRKTRRPVRHLVMIHQVEELDVYKQLADAAIAADAKFRSNTTAE